MIFDIHTHTDISSCSRLKVDEIINRAGEIGLDGVCITDHQSMDIRHQVKEGIQHNGVCLIIGMEYETPDGDFLLFGPFENLPKDLPATSLLEQVQINRGIAIAAHPFRNGRPIREYIVRDGLCRTVETINGRNSDIENLKVNRWKKNYPLIECGGSDAHTIDELGTVVTRFGRPVRSREDFIFAVKKGMCTPDWYGREDLEGMGNRHGVSSK